MLSISNYVSVAKKKKKSLEWAVTDTLTWLPFHFTMMYHWLGNDHHKCLLQFNIISLTPLKKTTNAYAWMNLLF